MNTVIQQGHDILINNDGKEIHNVTNKSSFKIIIIILFIEGS